MVQKIFEGNAGLESGRTEGSLTGVFAIIPGALSGEYIAVMESNALKFDDNPTLVYTNELTASREMLISRQTNLGKENTPVTNAALHALDHHTSKLG